MYKILPFFLILAYFIFHIITGERGLLSNQDLNQEIFEKKLILLQLIKERKVLEERINKISLGNLDQDLLDEIVRRDLGFSEQGEKVLLLP
jgi:cell division protein FtsB